MACRLHVRVAVKEQRVPRNRPGKRRPAPAWIEIWRGGVPLRNVLVGGVVSLALVSGFWLETDGRPEGRGAFALSFSPAAQLFRAPLADPPTFDPRSGAAIRAESERKLRERFEARRAGLWEESALHAGKAESYDAVEPTPARPLDPDLKEAVAAIAVRPVTEHSPFGVFGWWSPGPGQTVSVGGGIILPSARPPASVGDDRGADAGGLSGGAVDSDNASRAGGDEGPFAGDVVPTGPIEGTLLPEVLPIDEAGDGTGSLPGGASDRPRPPEPQPGNGLPDGPAGSEVPIPAPLLMFPAGAAILLRRRLQESRCFTSLLAWLKSIRPA